MLPLLAVAAASCHRASTAGGLRETGAARSVVVRIVATPEGCPPKPGRVAAGRVEVDVENLDAETVSEIEIRTPDLSHLLGEKENLIEGLSASFAVVLVKGRYIVNCPGAFRPRWPLVAIASRTAGPR